MDFLQTSVLAQVCLGIGLAQLAGLRAFLPVALIGVFSAFELFGAPALAGTWFSFFAYSWVWIGLFGCAFIELVLDKLPLMSQVQDLLFGPLRLAAGAVVFGAALAAQLPAVIIVGMIAGALLASAAHFAKGALRITRSADGLTNAFMSLFFDLVVAAGAVATLLFPLLGILFLLFLLYFLYRVKKTRRKKYKGLRLLRE
jgi:hypothetical protein